MKKTRLIRFVCDIWTVIFALGFAMALLWYLGGSFEAAPTEEQQGKAQIGAALLMAVCGALSAAGIAVRIKLGRRRRG